MAKVRVVRTIVIEGTELWVHEVLKRSWVSPGKPKEFGTLGKVYENPRIEIPVEDSQNDDRVTETFT